jgi:hypothetical protein
MRLARHRNGVAAAFFGHDRDPVLNVDQAGFGEDVRAVDLPAYFTP